METQELHRGRLIDHIQLVVADLPATRRFYDAIFAVLGVPLGGAFPNGDFWYDELFISTADSEAAQGAAGTTARRASGPIIRATMPPSCSIRLATMSRRCFTARPDAARRRCASPSSAF